MPAVPWLDSDVTAGELEAEPHQLLQTHIISHMNRLGPQLSRWLIITQAVMDTSPNQQVHRLTWEQELITAWSFWLLFHFS